jgi:hypothetical protein
MPRIFDSTMTTIDQMCTFLEQVQQRGDPITYIDDIGQALRSQQVDQNTVSNITSCLMRALA